MINPIELVIFDCDGVLVDSEHIAVRVHSAVLTDLGWPLTEAEVTERFVGRSSKSIDEEIEAHLGRLLTVEAAERFHRLHREAVDAELTPVDGIVEALDAITLRTCVASGGSHDKMRHTLGRTGLYQRFEGRIFSATEVTHGKPAPDLFLHAAERMGADPAACVVVEDSRYGVQAARAAGMRVFGYCGGLRPAHWLEGPDTVVFDDMRELPALLTEPRGIAGTAGYGEVSDLLADQYESVTFAEVHREVLHLFPAQPSRVLDLGAGTGRDAAALSRLGHTVVAVEPTAELRAHGQRLHPATGIEWVDDHLPELTTLRRRPERYDLILLTAVWMHLDEQERSEAMKHLTGLLVPHGRIILSLRHGPVPTGRRMFEVSADETIHLAAATGLHALHRSERKDPLGRQDVHWTFIALQLQ
ncbi:MULTISPECIES: HAD-IA family hydrolase [unclassified Streptosporangium]|uniref:HAD-IA family hydrolase n=1 Tax=unclassified Streptosporangium TaxID=2632669 RepID=UPI002E2D55A9|nr:MULTISPECIES: HAD-IA family hydrolase [unclassified Streptosporangium]